MAASSDESLERRRKLVDTQLRTGGVTSIDVLSAFLAVPREGYFRTTSPAVLHSDAALPSRASGRIGLPPLELARLLQAAAIGPGARVLDVGGGGYAAALAAEMGAQATALDTSAPTATAGVAAKIGALSDGAPEAAPFDAIVLDGAFERDPRTLLSQLGAEGRLVGFRARGDLAHAVVIEKGRDGGYSERALFEGVAPPLNAFLAEPTFAF